MKYYYYIVIHDFKQKNSFVFEYCNKYDGLNLIEVCCEEHIKQLIGNEKIKYYNEGDTNRDYGYFIEKSKNDLNKLTVKRKYIKYRGYFVNDVVIDDIISFGLAKCECDKLNIVLVEFYENDEFICKERYDKVIEQIRTVIEVIDSDKN